MEDYRDREGVCSFLTISFFLFPYLLSLTLCSLAPILSLPDTLHSDSPPNSCARLGPPPMSDVPFTPTCSPRWDLLFLKTHKTGSSTVLNMLFRYGEHNKLSFAFPSGGRSDFAYPAPFSRRSVAGNPAISCFNVVASHMRFEPEEAGRLLPLERVYFTLLRHPARLFESSFHYYGPSIPLTWHLPGPDKMDAFLRKPRAYYNPQAFNAHYLRNLQFFDLGQDKDMEPSHPAIPGILQSLEESFSLVMLTEYFDESLVLLKDLLCWDLEDVLYFPLNMRDPARTPPALSPAAEKLALSWNQLDALLYAHFNRTFWRKVDIFGRWRMAWEVAELRRANAMMGEACLDGGGPVKAGLVRDPSLRPWQPAGGAGTIMGYNLRPGLEEVYQDICRSMLTPEMQYMSKLGANLWRVKAWSILRGILGW